MSALLFLFPYDLHIGEMLVLSVSNQVYLLVIRSIQIYYNNIYYPIIYIFIFIIYIIIISYTTNGTIYTTIKVPFIQNLKENCQRLFILYIFFPKVNQHILN